MNTVGLISAVLIFAPFPWRHRWAMGYAIYVLVLCTALIVFMLVFGATHLWGINKVARVERRRRQQGEP
jgi:cell division protein FtsW (lipid II flippase)